MGCHYRQNYYVSLLSTGSLFRSVASIRYLSMVWSTTNQSPSLHTAVLSDWNPWIYLHIYIYIYIYIYRKIHTVHTSHHLCNRTPRTSRLVPSHRASRGEWGDNVQFDMLIFVAKCCFSFTVFSFPLMVRKICLFDNFEKLFTLLVFSRDILEGWARVCCVHVFLVVNLTTDHQDRCDNCNTVST